MRSNHMHPPTYLFTGLVGMGLLHVLLPGPRLISGPWRLLGVVIAALGAWLSIRADALFKELGTEIKPFRSSSLVVTHGPFRFTRHPVYLGFVGIVLGMGVLAGTLLPLLMVMVMFGLIAVLFVLPEERHMEKQFGEDYRQYRSQVRRWL